MKTALKFPKAIICAIVFGVLSSCFATSGGKLEEDKLIGIFALVIENDSYHGYGNYLEITALGKDSIKGKIGIDWGLGPEGRAPLAWETMYESEFDAKLSGRTFSFDAETAVSFERFATVYGFTLTIAKKQNGYVFDGTVSIRKKADEAAKASVHKVSAYKTSDEE